MTDKARNSPGLFVAAAEQAACVKVTGRANFTSSVPFKTLIHQLQAGGVWHFVLELSECVTMDSTFLGVLAGFALKQADGHPGEKFSIELLNPNPRVFDLLENLGVSHLFKVHQTAPAGSVDYVAPAVSAATSREEISRTCLEAHQTLMAVNPANIPKFKEVTLFLAEDLKKLKPGLEPGPTPRP